MPNGGIVPDAEIDDQGVVHLAYYRDGDTYYATSDNDGETFNDPIRVNSEQGFAYGGAYRGPDIAIGKDSTIHVVWFNAAYQQKRPKDQWGVMYSRLRPRKTSFEPTKNLNHRPSDNFSVAADKNGKLAVFWMADGVFAVISRDGGDSFSERIDLKTDPCECCGSRAIYSADGILSILYRDKADNDRDTYLAYLAKDQQQFEHVKVSQAMWPIESCPMTGSFLTHTPDGLIAGWETKGQIYFGRLNSKGQLASGREIHVSRRGRYPVALTAGDGVTLVAWKNGPILEWQLFDRSDAPIGRRGSKTDVSVDRPAGVVTIDGSFLLFP